MVIIYRVELIVDPNMGRFVVVIRTTRTSVALQEGSHPWVDHVSNLFVVS